MTSGVLQQIVLEKRLFVSRLEGLPLPKTLPDALDPVDRLSSLSTEHSLHLIAEVKFRSPSGGQLGHERDLEKRVVAYAEGGVAMISVLTDEPYFGGSFSHLYRTRGLVEKNFGKTRPLLLCKDFVIAEIQLDWARACGADSVLLIARILDAFELERLFQAARKRGLEPLVEVHSEQEAKRAIDLGAQFIGVNARDLDTLAIDHARAARVFSLLHYYYESSTPMATVYLSGIQAPRDVVIVQSARAHAVLIGEALMRAEDPRALLLAMKDAATVAA